MIELDYLTSAGAAGQKAKAKRLQLVRWGLVLAILASPPIHWPIAIALDSWCSRGGAFLILKPILLAIVLVPVLLATAVAGTATYIFAVRHRMYLPRALIIANWMIGITLMVDIAITLPHAFETP